MARSSCSHFAKYEHVYALYDFQAAINEVSSNNTDANFKQIQPPPLSMTKLSKAFHITRKLV